MHRIRSNRSDSVLRLRGQRAGDVVGFILQGVEASCSQLRATQTLVGAPAPAQPTSHPPATHQRSQKQQPLLTVLTQLALGSLRSPRSLLQDDSTAAKGRCAPLHQPPHQPATPSPAAAHRPKNTKTKAKAKAVFDTKKALPPTPSSLNPSAPGRKPKKQKNRRALPGMAFGLAASLRSAKKRFMPSSAPPVVASNAVNFASDPQEERPHDSL